MENLCPMPSARRDLLATASDGQVDLGVAWVNKKAKFEKYVYICQILYLDLYAKYTTCVWLNYTCVLVCLWLHLSLFL